jgi:hypothetical protein
MTPGGDSVERIRRPEVSSVPNAMNFSSEHVLADSAREMGRRYER